jgi:adenosylhomocysteine nucleosidase
LKRRNILKIETVDGVRILFVMALGQEYGPHLRARIDPLLTGVGPIEAAVAMGMTLARLADQGRAPDLVVSLGSAGSRRCALGEVYQVGALSWRDMDASRLGFAEGVTPFLDHPAIVALPTPWPDLPVATLSTGANIVGGDDYGAIAADMVDMESFAILRACQRFGIPMIGLRGISDGLGELDGLQDWTALLALLDERLAAALDRLDVREALK